MGEPNIDALLHEERSFPPPPAFAAKANVRDPGIYAKALTDPEAFWAKEAGELTWMQTWSQVLDWRLPDAKWFVGAKLNASVNCIDRHANGPRRDKRAIVWEGEPGEERALTYAQLLDETCRIANGLKSLGVGKGDRVAIYLPMAPEAAIAMLACARIGAVHSVVFAGFSATAIATRIHDAEAKLVITSDASYRRGKLLRLKDIVDEAVAQCPSVEKVVVWKRASVAVAWHARDVWWHELAAGQSLTCEPEPMDAEDPLFTLYTSGTTGKPKGVLHTTGGYMVGVNTTTRFVFDIHEDDIYWCTADVGWITGHSYVVYGPLSTGATVIMYEGAPDHPEKDRFWRIIAKHKVTIFYTAPTAIRTFMQWGAAWLQKHDLSSLRLLGSVGEPINPEAWMWYHEYVGGSRCPIVDTWWQTETGMILLTTLPGIDAARPGYTGKAFPGVAADIVDEQGRTLTEDKAGGHLVFRGTWPAMARTLWRDPERWRSTYWTRYPGAFFTSDGARRDHGYHMVLGRVDDVIKVSGHRIGTMEVESALVSHPAVAEAAVVGKLDAVRGEAIIAFVIPKSGAHVDEKTLRDHVANELGAIARPERLILTPELPKTRSGKIMRRLLRDIAEGRPAGDATTLADPTVVERLRELV